MPNNLKSNKATKIYIRLLPICIIIKSKQMRNEKVICAKCPFPEKCGIKILRIDKQWNRSRAFAAMWSQEHEDTWTQPDKSKDWENHFTRDVDAIDFKIIYNCFKMFETHFTLLMIPTFTKLPKFIKLRQLNMDTFTRDILKLQYCTGRRIRCRIVQDIFL